MDLLEEMLVAKKQLNTDAETYEQYGFELAHAFAMVAEAKTEHDEAFKVYVQGDESVESMARLCNAVTRLAAARDGHAVRRQRYTDAHAAYTRSKIYFENKVRKVCEVM